MFSVRFFPLFIYFFKLGVSVYISAFTLMSIAIDRYFVILHPFKPRMLMKSEKKPENIYNFKK